MELQAYKDIVSAAMAEAKAYISQSEIKNEQEALSSFEWEDFYSNGKGRNTYDGVKNALLKELTDPIISRLNKGDYSEEEYFHDLHDAEEKFHYRFLEMLGVTPEEVDSNWINKSLSRSYVVDDLYSRYRRHEYIERSRTHGPYMNIEASLAQQMYDLKIGKTVIGFYDAEDSKYKFKETYTEMAKNASPEELIGVLINITSRLDGRRPHYPLEEITNKVVSKAVSVLYQNPNIGSADIAKLRELGVVKSTHYWDTRYFHENHAPVITDEYANKIKEQLTQDNRHTIFFELKDSLSKQEILSYFMNRGSYREIDNWKRSMASYEAVTGERLTFKEAQEMRPMGFFSLGRTQAYSDRVDRLSDPDSYRKITTTINPMENKEYEKGTKVFLIDLECKSIMIDSISIEMQKESCKHPGITSSCYTGESIWFEFVSDKKDAGKEVRLIAASLEKKFNELNKAVPLPGDIVRVIGEEADDYELKYGSRGLVTDVDLDGSVKLKGDSMYFPARLFEIKKKYEPSAELNNSLSR